MALVLFNDLIVFRQRSGIGHYAAQLLAQYPHVAPDLPIVRLSTLPRVRWIADAMRKASSEAGRERRGPAPRSGGPLKTTAQGVLDRYLSWAVGKGDWGLLHEPDAIAFRTSVRTLVSVMDLSVILFPQWHPIYRVKKYEKYFARSLEQSAHFIAISEATKRDMVRHLHVKADRVTVIPLAPRAEVRTRPGREVAAIKSRLSLPGRYLLFVGNLEPRKNLPGLLRAYSRLPGSLRSDCPLVLVGGWGWKSEILRDMLDRAPWNRDVRHLGYLPDADLAAVTQGATALVYPSFYEGFGLPPLEAMAVGTPVISSTAGGLAEAVGDAALVVEPNDEEALAGAMKEVVVNEGLRQRLSASGAVQAARFSWETTARRTAEVYRRLLA
jgi:glycosyltransferase involved in cell wall biosynthesis